jgi:hypothetical protein
MGGTFHTSETAFYGQNEYKSEYVNTLIFEEMIAVLKSKPES